MIEMLLLKQTIGSLLRISVVDLALGFVSAVSLVLKESEAEDDGPQHCGHLSDGQVEVDPPAGGRKSSPVNSICG